MIGNTRQRGGQMRGWVYSRTVLDRWMDREAVSNERSAVEFLNDRVAVWAAIFAPARWQRDKLKATKARPAFRARCVALLHRLAL